MLGRYINCANRSPSTCELVGPGASRFFYTMLGGWLGWCVCSSILFSTVPLPNQIHTSQTLLYPHSFALANMISNYYGYWNFCSALLCWTAFLNLRCCRRNDRFT